MKTLENWRIAALISVSLSGCASQAPLEIPQGGPTTLDVYQQHVGSYQARNHNEDSTMDEDDVLVAPGTVTVAEEVQYQQPRIHQRDFPRLPNWEFSMFVYPHLSASGNPIPFYRTAWPLYEKTHYALPGEVIMNDQ